MERPKKKQLVSQFQWRFVRVGVKDELFEANFGEDL